MIPVTVSDLSLRPVDPSVGHSYDLTPTLGSVRYRLLLTDRPQTWYSVSSLSLSSGQSPDTVAGSPYETLTFSSPYILSVKLHSQWSIRTQRLTYVFHFLSLTLLINLELLSIKLGLILKLFFCFCFLMGGVKS